MAVFYFEVNAKVQTVNELDDVLPNSSTFVVLIIVLFSVEISHHIGV